MSYRRVVVVVCGNLGAGKDTTADALKELLPDAVRDSYAAPLKMCVHLKTGIPMRILNGTQAEKEDLANGAYSKTPRLLMQEEGEEARQRLGPTVWSDRFCDRFALNQARIAIISDGRHPDQEIVAVRQRVPKDTLVVAIRVKRPSVPIKRGHPSEDKIADAPDSTFDVNMLNDGTREHYLTVKIPQLADYIYLWALTEKRPQDGWIVRCPSGGRQRWSHAGKTDAQMLAHQLMSPCLDCATMSEHKVEAARFDGLLTSG